MKLFLLKQGLECLSTASLVAGPRLGIQLGLALKVTGAHATDQAAWLSILTLVSTHHESVSSQDFYKKQQLIFRVKRQVRYGKESSYETLGTSRLECPLPGLSCCSIQDVHRGSFLTTGTWIRGCISQRWMNTATFFSS